MRAYLLITSVIFGVVAIVHTLRLALHWPLVIAGWEVPIWVSVIGVIVPGALSAWALRLRGGTPSP